MQGKSIKLIAFDLDGTLLNSKKEIDKKTIKLLKQLRESKGIHLAIATGRDSATVLPLMNHFCLDKIMDLVIMNNGATVFYPVTKSWKYNEYLSTSKIKEILDLYKDHSSISLCFHNEDTFYATKITPKIIKIKENNKRQYLRDPYVYAHYQKTPRIMAVMDEPNDQKFIDYATKHIPKETIAYHSEPHIFEFQDYRISKVKALNDYCETHGMVLDNVMAFGDSDNDVSLLSKCGIGVCMKNGTKNALKSADSVTKFTSDENGIYYYLSEIVENN